MWCLTASLICGNRVRVMANSRREDLEQRAVEAYNAGDYDEAESIVKRLERLADASVFAEAIGDGDFKSARRYIDAARSEEGATDDE